jgi:L-fuculose-phosphate aldolase
MSIRALKPESQRFNEESIHFKIAAARRILFRAGLDSQVGGHVSVRVPGEDAFWTTPFQYFDETLPEHVSKVSFDLRVLEQGTLPASPGINFHASIMRSRPDVNCTIHTHARSISALATTGRSFDVYYVYGCMFADLVTSFVDDPTLTPDAEGEAIATALGNNKVVLMPHHGSVHCGDTLEHTVAETIAFAIACEYQLDSIRFGGQPMDARSARSYKDAYYKFGFREQMWLANYRRLRISDPDLFFSLLS